MMHPMRVEWSEPDRVKQDAAMRQFESDRASLRAFGRAFDETLALAGSPAERFEIMVKRYPDLNATIRYFGTMLSIRYVPAQHGVTMGASGRTAVHVLCPSKWVALVATMLGTREMDPTTLTVMWSSAPGDPICGVVNGPSR